MELNTTATFVASNDYSNKSLNEILTLFKEMLDRADQQELYKNAEPIKAAFYKVLRKEKIAAGAFIEIGQSSDNKADNPFEEIEKAFKELYSNYKLQRDSFNKEAKEKREENYKQKIEIIEQINLLREKAEDVNLTFPAFRELQERWKSIGSVPVEYAKELWDNYNRTVEKFYDYIKINNEFRDLDFRKNLQAKSELCEKAESLINSKDPIAAFNELQKLHEEWKELGPVAKNERENIWNRFKSATSVINKKHQDYFDKLKEQQKANLVDKTLLCEQAEKIAAEKITESQEWNTFTKQIEELQQKWKKIGFASKKDNQKIYDRFRAACDQFYNGKREYYSKFKDVMQDNLQKKEDLCQQVEALKDSTDWKRATDQIINIQKVWKQIGPVARKQSDAVWKRFRAACDEFFENKSKHFGISEEGYKENLLAKKQIIQDVKDFNPSEDKQLGEALEEFLSRWNSIGFVPIKDKDSIQKEFDEVLDIHFKDIRDKSAEKKMGRLGKLIADAKTSGKSGKVVKAERDKLVAKYKKLESDITTLENNIGFFAKSKNADKLIEEIRIKVEKSKEELKQIEQKIKMIDKEF